MKELGYGKEYKYNPHFTAEELKDQTYLPDELVGTNFSRNQRQIATLDAERVFCGAHSFSVAFGVRQHLETASCYPETENVFSLICLLFFRS